VNVINQPVKLADNINILNRWRNIVFLFVAHFANDMTQIFSGASSRQSWNNVTVLETSYWANVLSNQINTFLWNCFRAMSVNMLSFNGHKCNRNFPLNLIEHTNNDSLSYLIMHHENFLHLSSWQSMASSIDNIIFSWHYMKITVFVVKSRVSCIVIPFKCWEVFIHVHVVVV